jgi:hypothetical protein
VDPAVLPRGVVDAVHEHAVVDPVGEAGAQAAGADALAEEVREVLDVIPDEGLANLQPRVERHRAEPGPRVERVLLRHPEPALLEALPVVVQLGKAVVAEMARHPVAARERG